MAAADLFDSIAHCGSIITERFGRDPRSFMWSPKRNAKVSDQFYEKARGVPPCYVRVLGPADTGSSESASSPSLPRPVRTDFRAAGSNWARDGWFVPGVTLHARAASPEGARYHPCPFMPSSIAASREAAMASVPVYFAEVSTTLADAGGDLIDRRTGTRTKPRSRTSGARRNRGLGLLAAELV